MTPRESGVRLATGCAIGPAGGASPPKGLRRPRSPQAARASAAASSSGTAGDPRLRSLAPASPITSLAISGSLALVQYILCHPFHKGNEAHGAEVGVFQPTLGSW